MKAVTLFAILLVLSACSPSEQSIQTAVAKTQAAYTPTLTPSPVPTETLIPTATATPDVALAYFQKFLPYIEEWGEQFQNLDDLNQRISNEGVAILDDETFKDELTTTMAKWEAAAKNAADIPAPNEDLQRFRDMAEELHAQTETYTSFYILAITTGDATSTELAIDALNRAGEIFTVIANEIEKGNYIP